tara:strand:+ start:21 stop:1247 length:1227 start_codon:yes stop_codon:yes gene_type:complete
MIGFGQSLAIGDTFLGGIIFYLDGNGGGLISAPSDQSSAAEWGCFGTSISGAEGTAIGTGNQNTIDIEAGCTTSGTAADICANLTLGGFSDWFLPSKDELEEMYLNIGQGDALGLGNVGGFANNYYWSSTEVDLNDAWAQDFYSGLQFVSNKNDYYGSVRAVRAFSDVTGCTDSTALNYDPLATIDDGSCIPFIYGCTDSTATNYNATANISDGSCTNCYVTADIGMDTINACDSVLISTNTITNGSYTWATTTPAIGDTFQGGIIFYLDSLGGGLISAPSEQSVTGEGWGCYGTAITGAGGAAIGTGAQNTIDIEAGCAAAGTAADICANLTLGGYSDWFLPSKDELNEMYLNKSVIGGFINGDYWSSSEDDATKAWRQDFGNGGTSGVVLTVSKNATLNVRAIRAF